MSNAKQRYNTVVKPALREKFGIQNVMNIPGLEKIVINMGIAQATKDKNAVQDHIRELTMLSGQKPILTKARISVSNFKLRAGQEIGIKVTLRGKRMYDFLERWVNIICPRMSDFRGLPEKLDGMGNYTVGISSQEVFPEVDLDKHSRSQGMDITFVTSAQNDEEGLELLRLLGMPFKSKDIVHTYQGQGA
jgi:large subunit ribosomal protein L5